MMILLDFVLLCNNYTNWRKVRHDIIMRIIALFHYDMAITLNTCKLSSNNSAGENRNDPVATA